MNEIVGANSNIAKNSNLTVVKLEGRPNIDPLAQVGDSARTNQQVILPTAINPRFINIIKQTPSTDNQMSLSPEQIGVVRIDIPSNNTYTLSFEFDGANDNLVLVDLATSLFIDEVTFDTAYPIGGNINPLNWGIEKLKTAYRSPDFSAAHPTYFVNQINQDNELLIIKNFDSVAHPVYVYYYWRFIVNSGGAKRNTT